MAAHMVRQVRGLCRIVSVLKGNCDVPLQRIRPHRLVANISRSGVSVESRSGIPSLTCLSSRGLHTDPAKQEQEPDQVQSSDHPVADLDDPFKEPVQPCILCQNQVPLSYKNVQLLSQFVSPNTGKIYGRHITKLCSYQQKQVSKAIKRAKQMGFMPYMYRETVFLKDPNLFDIRYTGNVDIAMQEPSDLIQPEMQDADKESDDKK
ncbi:uncharacterized protein [Asterias amurensis]|uniref:uncharacterized protein isoform X1 n=1 Tax=Asterias amurensis TaxID=7602 RepID=UPI003AB8C8CA